MPGYLSHLAARVFGSRPTIRPRIAPLFEPAPAAVGARESAHRGLRVVDEERIVPQPAPVRPKATFPEDAASLAHLATELAVPEPHIKIPARREPPRVETVEAKEDKVTPASVGLREPLLKTIALRDSEMAPIERAPARREPRVTESGEAAGPILPRSIARRLEVSADSSRLLHTEFSEPMRTFDPQPVEPRVEAPRPVQERSPAVTALSPAATTVLASHPELRPMERSPALPEREGREAPSIQVTIGRLIVEAVAPAPARMPSLASSRAPGPQLSLDDYLRQRRSQT